MSETITKAIEALKIAETYIPTIEYEDYKALCEALSALTALQEKPATVVPGHWSVTNPGKADHYRGEAMAARRALGFAEDSQEVSPADITERISALQPSPAREDETPADQSDAAAARATVRRLVDEREQLALAICGGEDAPGYANAQTVEALVEHGADIDRATAAEAERDELRAAIFGPLRYQPDLTNRAFVEMVQATEAGRLGAVSRATAAEARVAVLEGHLKTALRIADRNEAGVELDAARAALGRAET
jgi:hypothetical protein